MGTNTFYAYDYFKTYAIWIKNNGDSVSEGCFTAHLLWSWPWIRTESSIRNFNTNPLTSTSCTDCYCLLLLLFFLWMHFEDYRFLCFLWTRYPCSFLFIHTYLLMWNRERIRSTAPIRSSAPFIAGLGLVLANRHVRRAGKTPQWEVSLQVWFDCSTEILLLLLPHIQLTPRLQLLEGLLQKGTCPSVHFGDISPQGSNGTWMNVTLMLPQAEWGPKDLSLFSLLLRWWRGIGTSAG